MIGLICVGFAVNDFSYTLFGYATDSYGASAASAVSAVSLTRTLAAAALPLFAYQMYTGLGSNVATTKTPTGQGLLRSRRDLPWLTLLAVQVRRRRRRDGCARPRMSE